MKKIAVQCKDHIGAIEFGNHARASAERGLRSRVCSLTHERLINAPAHAGEIFFQLSAQPVARGRVCFLYKKRHAVAVLGEKLIAKFSDVSLELFALARFSIMNKPFRAGWIVQVQNRRLSESVCRAATGRVQRIAIQLNRSPVDRRGYEWNSSISPRHRRGVVEKFSGNRPLNVLCERNEMELGPATTR